MALLSQVWRVPGLLDVAVHLRHTLTRGNVVIVLSVLLLLDLGVLPGIMEELASANLDLDCNLLLL